MTTQAPHTFRRPRRHAFSPSPARLEARLTLSTNGALAIVAHQSPAAFNQGRVNVVREVVYRDVPGDRQTLDLYIPAGPAPQGGRAVIVAIHGGGWRRFSKEQYEPTVAPLATMGFIVAVPDYRLSRPGVPTWPTNLDEVGDAVRWVRTHASDLGADPNQIAAMGASAGGHLAAMLGTDPEASTASTTSAQVEAVVDFYGPTDLAALDATSPAASPAIRQYLGTTPRQAPALYADASPATHVSAGAPPFLIVQGSADHLVPPAQSQELAARLTAVGVPNRLVIVPGAGHGFGLGHGLRGEVADFLQNALKPEN